MTHRSTLSFAALVAAFALSGCTATTFEVPKTPNPVMLGKVDRIGGGAADPTEKTVAVLTGGGALRPGSARSGMGDRGGQFVPEGTSERVTSAAFVQQVWNATEMRAERTVHVTKVKPVSYFMVIFVGAFVFASAAQDVEVTASVTERGAPAPTTPASLPPASTKKEVARVDR